MASKSTHCSLVRHVNNKNLKIVCYYKYAWYIYQLVEAEWRIYASVN